MRKPLQAKLKKDVIWNWSNTDTDYIKKIKKILINFPKLYLPNIEDSLIIETDASDEFWGGVLKAKTLKKKKNTFAGTHLAVSKQPRKITIAMKKNY